ncbi:MAG: FAD-dependent oxidoreductase [Pseudomonadota bacterium]
MKIAVIGSGIAGNSAAWALHHANHHVTLFEADNRAGGHAATVTIDYDGTPVSVDTGFIVYNEHNYPDLVGLFDELGVETIASNMSFCVSRRTGHRKRQEWNLSDYTAILASAPNFLRPSFRKLVSEIRRFARQSIEDLEAGRLAGLTLGDYCKRYDPALGEEFLLPMGAAIWSTPGGDFTKFPADSFVQFFANHRILDWNSPVWYTVKGGSENYVRKLLAPLLGRIRMASPVDRVRRHGNQVFINVRGEPQEEAFDAVIFACHSDQALAALADPSDLEAEVLSSVPYKTNKVYLHRDPSFMPKNRAKWASWNYMDLTEDGRHDRDICVTYWMNRLQSIDKSKPLFVTLNPPDAPRSDLVFGEYEYAHPAFDGASMEAQTKLPAIQGARGTYFCGAWTGYGFHEDGLRSGLDVAELLGARIPWRAASVAVADAAE